MSVSSESRKGDRIYVIEGFIAKIVTDNKGHFDLLRSNELDIGDTVVFLDWSLETVGDELEIFIHYVDNNGEELKAKETYFVTEDVWNNLRAYFTSLN
ncbi:hypothetical protein SAMN05216378_3330 [Paenibacillus catalpae]|uniref:Uncharacterized protein n=1 Tax=Paenibacillus catalpae TaxID=1045775 RepID=A0A1I2B3N8_9BACL|nr:hypothetical protein [Paenibacillus catalpae]SFE49780.1 hypothetical protein SAMN05216378_3330 [Paenibacillus catalpae]